MYQLTCTVQDITWWMQDQLTRLGQFVADFVLPLLACAAVIAVLFAGLYFVGQVA